MDATHRPTLAVGARGSVGRLRRFLAAPVPARVAVVILAAATAALAVLVQLGVLLRASWNGAPGTPLAVSSERIDFGELPIHGEVVRHLVLRNDGPEPVRAWFFASGAVYSVIPRELTLAPGVEGRVAIIASADRPGLFRGELLVHVDDGTGPLVIDLSGEAPGMGEADGHASDLDGLQASRILAGPGGRS